MKFWTKVLLSVSFFIGISSQAVAGFSTTLFSGSFATSTVELTIPSSAAMSTFTSVPDWSRILDQQGGEGILFGVKIAGPAPFERNEGSVFMPASNTKLFTAALALEELGPNYRFSTRLQWRRVEESQPETIGGVRLLGSGDPTAGMMEFGEDFYTRVQRWAAVFEAEGVKEIQGDIQFVSSDSRWDDLRYPEGWLPEDRTSCYGAQATSFNFNINCAQLVISGPKKAQWVEPGVPTKIQLSIRNATASEGTELSLTPVSALNGVPLSFEVKGRWVPGSSPRTLVVPVHQAALWMKNLFIQALKEKGIRLVRDSASSPVAALQGELREREFLSPPLREILKPFLKDSLNIIGETLFKVVGSQVAAQGDLIGLGQRASREWLERNQWNGPDVAFWDGSGVSRGNRVNTGVVMSLLVGLTRQAAFGDVWEALPIAGVDGTLKNRMKGTAAEGVLRAKTGTLRGVYNLSGYVPRMDVQGRSVDGLVPFVILSKTVDENKQAARDAQDRVGAALAELVNPRNPVIP